MLPARHEVPAILHEMKGVRLCACKLYFWSNFLLPERQERVGISHEEAEFPFLLAAPKTPVVPLADGPTVQVEGVLARRTRRLIPARGHFGLFAARLGDALSANEFGNCDRRRN